MARKGKLQESRLVALNASTATLISDADQHWVSRVIKNVDSTITVYIGTVNVTGSTDGFELKAGQSMTEDVISSKLYGFAASGTPNVNIMEIGGN